MLSQLYQERLSRIRKAVALEPVDKVPIAPCANAFFARHKGLKLSEYVHNLERNADVALETLTELGNVDATQATVFGPYLLPTMWLSDIAVPGVELSDDDMWQVVEKRNVTEKDYDFILAHGFEAFYVPYVQKRLKHDYFEKCGPFFEYAPIAGQRFKDASIPCICDFLMITPFEFFCGGRSLEVFFLDDLLEKPDKIEKIFELTMEYTMADYRKRFEIMKPIGVWVGGWRSASEMMSPKLWDRFVWPYMKAYADLALECGAIPIFHLDSNWNRSFEYFKQMPKGKCILALDGKSDIYLAKKVLGDHMCILGDVKAELLAFGEPEDVYKKCTELIRDIGPTGFILASGCDIPSNAKYENVMAMVRAADDSRK